MGSSSAIWIATVAYVIFECSVLTIAWRQTCNFVLSGFQSDAGYTLTALGFASFAVVLVVWIKVSSYFLLMIAAALLLRIKLHTGRGGAVISFVGMIVVSLAGLALSWLPTLIETGQLALFVRNRF